jgi:hypothetical protein
MLMLPEERRLFVVLIILAVVILVYIIVSEIRDYIDSSISHKYNERYVKKRRKTNPCYHCPRSRKYICDGCYIKLRREYENGRKRE